jgi:hypothetical protein
VELQLTQSASHHQRKAGNVGKTVLSLAKDISANKLFMMMVK